jgi:4-oxalmesaconate hydratase
VGQLPQYPGVSPAQCIEELERMVHELGFVGVNLNPDPSGGYWSGPPMTDRHWYPLYEKLVELDMPAMIHVSSSCNPNFHATGAHYINADTSVFMQLIQGDLFKDFPTLKFVIPHGGGCRSIGAYRACAWRCADLRWPITCWRMCFRHLRTTFPASGCSAEAPVDNILLLGDAGRGADIDLTRHAFDDTRRYLDDVESLMRVTRFATRVPATGRCSRAGPPAGEGVGV